MTPLDAKLERQSLCRAMNSSLGTGHPSIQQIFSLLQVKHWLSQMPQEVCCFIQGCPECAISKLPHHLPSGKLLPLPVPDQPWSHLEVDFMTDLPESEGNTCILVVVDFFQSMQTDTPERITFLHWKWLRDSSKRYSETMDFQRILYQRSSICLTGMEELHEVTWCNS